MAPRFEYSWTLPTRRGAARVVEALRARNLVAALDDPVSQALESLEAECDETRTCIVFRARCNRVLTERERDLLLEALLYEMVDAAERRLAETHITPSGYAYPNAFPEKAST